MSPLSLAEMRENLRSKAILSRAIKTPVMPCQKRSISSKKTTDTRSKTAIVSTSSTTSTQPSPTLRTPRETVDELKVKLRQIEEERSVFLQEGVFDLVQFLCTQNRSEDSNDGSWSSQVISNIQDKLSQLQDQNDSLVKTLRKVGKTIGVPEDESVDKLIQAVNSKFI